MKLAQQSNFWITVIQKPFAEELDTMPASAEMRVCRQRTLTSGKIRERRCKLGEMCWLAAALRPDVSARLAQLTANVHTFQVPGIYRSNNFKGLCGGI